MNIPIAHFSTTLVWCLAAIATGLVYQQIGVWRDARRFPPPGRRINGLHLIERGPATGPPVILEAGIAGSSLSWQLVEDRIATFARVVSYDRAGLGWSAAARTPRTLENIVAELRAMLTRAGIAPPYTLVGHSFGGLVVRYFAAHHPAEVAAILLVDAVPVADWYPLRDTQRQRLARGVSLSQRGVWLARFGIVRFALARLMSGAQWIPRLVARFSAHNASNVMTGLAREIRKLPAGVWPIVLAQWCLPKNFRAMAAYLEALPANASAAAPLAIPEGIPAIALCSDYSNVEKIPHIDYRRVEDCGHWIQLDHPAIVADAVRELLS